ncbi:MAG: hypothetical protein JSW48_08340 [Betaproteobacteria bacterium]|jgi:hypothetical protein|nr:MAG: hypothetical protein JSW48_08340 [Betaproteobacteria bacterium]
MRATVLERKSDPDEKLTTIGIIVKEALDPIALLDALPPEPVRRIDGVRLNTPNVQAENATIRVAGSWTATRRFEKVDFCASCSIISRAIRSLILCQASHRAASLVYFHHKGVLDPQKRDT